MSGDHLSASGANVSRDCLTKLSLLNNLPRGRSRFEKATPEVCKSRRGRSIAEEERDIIARRSGSRRGRFLPASDIPVVLVVKHLKERATDSHRRERNPRAPVYASRCGSFR